MSHLATMASELRLKFGPLQALMEEISLRSRYRCGNSTVGDSASKADSLMVLLLI